MDPTPWPPHQAYLEGPAHLSRLPGRKVLRLEAQGLFARLRRFWCPKEEAFPPGVFRMCLIDKREVGGSSPLSRFISRSIHQALAQVAG